MAINNFHAAAFDNSTATKLALYKEYVDAWLPTFMTRSSKATKINIFDLFCGPGQDKESIDGSPLLLLKSIRKFLNKSETSTPPPITIYFNDAAQKKITQLKRLLATFKISQDKLDIQITCAPFEKRFDECRKKMTEEGVANLIFLDQCGISALTKERCEFLANCKRTDWICFMASSIVHRMPDHENISKFVQIEQGGRWADIHRTVTDYYRTVLKRSDYFLTPFSLRKGASSNVYGLIFGTNHCFGAEKFLRGCWKLDNMHGEANFPIEDPKSSIQGQLSFLEPRKKQLFQDEFEQAIISKKIKTNQDAYLFALHAGMLPDHARESTRALVKKGTLAQNVPISYTTIFKNNKIISFTLKK